MKKIFTLLTLCCIALSSLAQGWQDNYKGVMLQGFYWDSFDDTKWTNLEAQTNDIVDFFDLVWIPQSAKPSHNPSMGYDPLYWFSDYTSSFGTEKELLSLIDTWKKNGIGTIADIVINHRGNVSNWFDFPTETYEGVTYTMGATDIVKDDDKGKTQAEATKQGVLLSQNNDTGEGWDGMRDLDHHSPNVQKTVKAYLNMLINKFGYSGFRYDMVKGYAGSFTGLYNTATQPQFSVGEYFDSNLAKVKNWIESTRTGGVITSAAFDFPLRYAIRDAVNNGNWAALDGQGLAKLTDYARYAVTFVENHDTEDRGGGNTQDPIRNNISAANAYIMAMPGTPCVFLKHWQSCKKDIKNMITVRKLLGISNRSTATKLVSGNDFYAMVTKGDMGNLLTVVGPAATFATQSKWIKITGGENWAYYADKNTSSFAWADLPSGSYDGVQSVTLTAVTGNPNAKIVYTIDGSDPKASSSMAENESKITIPEGKATTLKVGLLINGTVTGISTRHYDIVDFQPYDISVYVNADNADDTWAEAKTSSPTPSINYYYWGSATSSPWPGNAVTTTTEIGGKRYFVKQFRINSSSDAINFVFNMGMNKSQTVDVMNIRQDTFIDISSQKDDWKYKVNTTTAIRGIECEKAGNTNESPYYYTLSGQRLKKPVQPGIYIHKGKKIIIK